MKPFNSYYNYDLPKEVPPQYSLDAIKDYFSKDPYKFSWTNKINKTPEEFPFKSRAVLASRKISPKTARALIKTSYPLEGNYVPIANINITLHNFTSSPSEPRKDVILVPYVAFNGVRYLTTMLNEIKRFPIKGGSVYVKEYLKKINRSEMHLFDVFPTPRVAVLTPFEFVLTSSVREDEIAEPLIIGDFVLAGYKYHPGIKMNLIHGYNMLNAYEKTSGDKVERMIQTIWDTNLMDKIDIVKIREYIDKPMEKIGDKDWGWLI